jgi:ketol-acid reductoisomerase
VTDKKILLDRDIDTSAISGRQLGLIGYGSQGRAQALNLRDSGFNPLIGVREGRSKDAAGSDGFHPLSIERVSTECGILMVLTPDETHADICDNLILPNVSPRAAIGFGAGFSVHFGLVNIPASHPVFLAAPKGPGAVLRQRFIEGTGIPAIVASRDNGPEGMAMALAYAGAIGCGRSGVIRASFREEAVADLFGEQCVLAGGMIELMKSAFDVLVDRGFPPEIAYIECIAEVEYMASLISRVGIAHLKDHISSTAFFGGATRGRRVIDESTKEKLLAVLDEIESGKFFSEFRESLASGEGLPSGVWSSEVLERARARMEKGD